MLHYTVRSFSCRPVQGLDWSLNMLVALNMLCQFFCIASPVCTYSSGLLPKIVNATARCDEPFAWLAYMAVSALCLTKASIHAVVAGMPSRSTVYITIIVDQGLQLARSRCIVGHAKWRHSTLSAVNFVKWPVKGLHAFAVTCAHETAQYEMNTCCMGMSIRSNLRCAALLTLRTRL